MGCNELLHILQRHTTKSDAENGLADHVRVCLHCRHGLIRLPDDPPLACPESALTCDQCLRLLPDYYEATHPDTPLIEMSEQEINTVIMHFAQCDACYDIYEEMVAVAAIEESGDQVG